MIGACETGAPNLDVNGKLSVAASAHPTTRRPGITDCCRRSLRPSNAHTAARTSPVGSGTPNTAPELATMPLPISAGVKSKDEERPHVSNAAPRWKVARISGSAPPSAAMTGITRVARRISERPRPCAIRAQDAAGQSPRNGEGTPSTAPSTASSDPVDMRCTA